MHSYSDFVLYITHSAKSRSKTQPKTEVMDKKQQTGHHIVDANKMITAVDWLVNQIFAKHGLFIYDKVIQEAKAMEKQQIIDSLILFCDTESYGACDIKDWVKNNGVIFKDKDTDSQIVDRVDYFVNNILNHNI
jgi:hypothetical protein